MAGEIHSDCWQNTLGCCMKATLWALAESQRTTQMKVPALQMWRLRLFWQGSVPWSTWSGVSVGDWDSTPGPWKCNAGGNFSKCRGTGKPVRRSWVRRSPRSNWSWGRWSWSRALIMKYYWAGKFPGRVPWPGAAHWRGSCLLPRWV